MPRFKILQYLPAYGPTPKHFGWKFPHESFLVEFDPENIPVWVGNFSPGGGGGISEVLEHPNGKHLIIIANGDAYIVDPETRTLQSTFSWGILYYDLVPELREIVFGNPVYFMAIGPSGILWKTRDIAWGDGIRAIKRDGMNLSGESYDPLNDSWVCFSIDLTNGNATGGSSFNSQFGSEKMGKNKSNGCYISKFNKAFSHFVEKLKSAK